MDDVDGSRRIPGKREVQPLVARNEVCRTEHDIELA